MYIKIIGSCEFLFLNLAVALNRVPNRLPSSGCSVNCSVQLTLACVQCCSEPPVGLREMWVCLGSS